MDVLVHYPHREGPRLNRLATSCRSTLRAERPRSTVSAVGGRTFNVFRRTRVEPKSSIKWQPSFICPRRVPVTVPKAISLLRSLVWTAILVTLWVTVVLERTVTLTLVVDKVGELPTLLLTTIIARFLVPVLWIKVVPLLGSILVK